MKFVKEAIAIIKSVPKPVWIAAIIPGGFVYIGALTVKMIYQKTRQHLTK